MRGTLVCAVNENDDGRAALEMAVELSERLGLRLVQPEPAPCRLFPVAAVRYR